MKNIDSKQRLYEIMGRVNPEFNKLNEGFVAPEDIFKFKQQLNNSVFYNYDNFSTDYDIDIIDSNIIIDWKLTFWLNNSGIENMIVNVDGINGNYVMKQYDKHSDELLGEETKDINEIEWKFITSEGNLSFNGSLYIKYLTFDIKNKTCTLEF